MGNNFGIIRVACATPKIKPGNPEYNCNEIIKLSGEAFKNGAGIICFPEFSTCGATSNSLFHYNSIYKANLNGLESIRKASENINIVIIVGSYFILRNKIINAACIIGNGEFLGIVSDRSQNGYISEASVKSESPSINICGEDVRICNSYFLDEKNNISFDISIGSRELPYYGQQLAAESSEAQIIFKPAAFPATYETDILQKNLTEAASINTISAICVAGAGTFESVTDEVYNGSSFIIQNGSILAANEPLSLNDSIVYGDIDTGILNFLRLRRNAGSKCTNSEYLKIVTSDPYKIKVPLNTLDLNIHSLISIYDKHPFSPADPVRMKEKCETVFKIQATGLARRVSQINAKTLVLGISGGLDSTLALLVCNEALKMLNRPSSDILAITMPGFGTSTGTFNNSHAIMDLLGATAREISIRNAVEGHFKDIEHNPEILDTTYENSQARERTQILMDLANKTSGIVVGTGDLSEAALGWCTYNGDHMSMYNVNCSVPKTFISDILHWYISEKLNGQNLYSKDDQKLSEILIDIMETPISPELLPSKQAGKEIVQRTEDKIGPYELHDFFIYYTVHCGLEPEKLLSICKILFKNKYSDQKISECLKIFYNRFFTQQFKRNCAPDGVRTDVVSFSPRNGFTIPSDIDFSIWTSSFE